MEGMPSAVSILKCVPGAAKRRRSIHALDQVMDIALNTIVATMMPYTMSTAGQEALCIRNSRFSSSRVISSASCKFEVAVIRASLRPYFANNGFFPPRNCFSAKNLCAFCKAECAGCHS